MEKTHLDLTCVWLTPYSTNSSEISLKGFVQILTARNKNL